MADPIGRVAWRSEAAIAAAERALADDGDLLGASQLAAEAAAAWAGLARSLATRAAARARDELAKRPYVVPCARCC
jgi:hypothetical protein